MTVYSASRPDDAVLDREIDDLLLHVRGLVLVRDLLARRGASQGELDAHTRELERQRERLASAVRGVHDPEEV
jgi:hypothetical protein